MRSGPLLSPTGFLPSPHFVRFDGGYGVVIYADLESLGEAWLIWSQALFFILGAIGLAILSTNTLGQRAK
jgi:hypothetical protein